MPTGVGEASRGRLIGLLLWRGRVFAQGDRGQLGRKCLCVRELQGFQGRNWGCREGPTAHTTFIGKGGAALVLERGMRVSEVESLESF